VTDKRRHSNIVDVRSFRRTDCDSDHYLVVAKVRQRLSVSKRAARKFSMERFNLHKINVVEVKEEYHVKISNRYSVSKNLDNDNDDMDIGKVWKSIREIMKASATESVTYFGLRQHKPCSDEECSELLDQSK